MDPSRPPATLELVDVRKVRMILFEAIPAAALAIDTALGVIERLISASFTA